MILSRNWLAKFLDLKKVTNQNITAALNSLGFEVEQEIDFQQLNDELIIGYVQESKLIPDTHLSFNLVDIGRRTPLKIVCGAPNVGAEQYVIVAQAGQTIANGLTLAKRKIQGYDSEGMICALNEIGIKDQFLTPLESDSIYVIEAPTDLKPLIGEPISQIGFDDYLWDIDLTLNRSDALAAFQLVKELANYFDFNIKKMNSFNKQKNLQSTIESNFKFTVDHHLQKNLQTLTWTQIEIQSGLRSLFASEDLLLKRLQIKSTSSPIEDLSLLATWQTGQTFVVLDQKVTGNHLWLETIVEAGKEIIVVKNQTEIVQVLGLPTNKKFQVGSQTSQILVLMISLAPELMRQQQKQLGQSSVNLQRYMKPLNPNLYQLGIDSFCQLLADYQVLKACSPLTIEKTKTPINSIRTLSLTKVKNLLGMEITVAQIKKLFRTLDIKVASGDQDQLIFTLDPNRTDLFGENDLVEEIARLYGYDKIEAVAPTMIGQVQKLNLKNQWQNKLENYLLGTGFQNIKTYSLLNHEVVNRWNLFNLTNPIRLQSPLSQLRETYRLSLSPSIIETATFNVANDNKRLKLWEIADVYTHEERQRHLSILTTGPILNEPLLHQTMDNNYFYLKGIVEAIFNFYKIDLTKTSFKLIQEPMNEMHPFINAEIKIQNEIVGYLYRLNPKFENSQKLSPTLVGELNLDLLAAKANKNYSLHPLSKFQSSARDISLIVPATFSYEKMIQQMLKGVNDVIDVRVVDQYQDEAMAKKNSQSLTISFTFNNLIQQMTETDIQKQWDQVLRNVKAMELKVR